MNLIKKILYILLFAQTGCSYRDAILLDERQLESEVMQLKRQIDSVKVLSLDMDLPYWKSMFELENLRHQVTIAEKDSIEDFYQNYVFRFRRPINAVIRPDPASPFIFPVRPEANGELWNIPVIWGRLFYFDYNHLGVDVYAEEGDTVRAIYDGVIRHYESAGGYGDLVVVIEHSYNEAWKKSSLPAVFISVYGHLRKEMIRKNGIALRWKEGDFIRKGEIVGFINDDENNGDGGEHLHFGIRLQSADEAKKTDSGRWLRGYDNRQGLKLKYFMNPIDLYGRYVQFIFN